MINEIVYVCNSVNNKNIRASELNILRKVESKLCFEFGSDEMNIKKRFYNDSKTLNKDFDEVSKIREKIMKEESKEKAKEEIKEENSLHKTESIIEIPAEIETVKKENFYENPKVEKHKITRKRK